LHRILQYSDHQTHAIAGTRRTPRGNDSAAAQASGQPEFQDSIIDAGRIDVSLAADYFVERFWVFAVLDPGWDWRSGAGTTVPDSSLLVDCEAGGSRS